MSDYILEMKHITKTFPGVKALDDVTFRLRPGTVHALMGENGAGKSTLMKCLFGIYHRDSGTVLFDGHEVDFKDSKEAIDAGVSMIHQELQPVRMMTIAENVFLGNYPLGAFNLVNHSKMNEDTKELLEEVGLFIEPTTLLNDLTVSQMQSVEIAKAISHKAKVVIMDEPTSSLTSSEVEKLFEIIETLKARNIGIIYISHKMDEILRISDDITVMRDGQYIGTWPAEEMTTAKIIQAMVGRELTSLFPEKTNQISDQVILELKDMTSPNPLSFKNASFTLRKGEILGIGGLVGAQRTELMEALYGMRVIQQGQIFVNGQEVTIKRPADAIKNKIALVTEDRRYNGIFGVLSITDNASVAALKEYVGRMGLLNEDKINRVVEDNVNRLRVKTPNNKTRIESLSGGNQQKVILARWLANNPDILILDEPTRGIDVGAKYEIYQIINALAAEGKAIIMITSEMSELLGVSDRIMVMCEGRVAGFLDRKDATQESVMFLATKFMGSHEGGETSV
ncbi:sugar ABC transporter ATP-binding protein [Streptococcus acidominimus]|uniref:Ribose/galactose/methyl galactoside import ATP-binding protein n=1 Tax=Streptococcus acidominimus TaxID=1326 RepID=A0A1Q8EDU6_STRAI|nr:sugar ABC transporter ATP-binding protein [Streptococcus acidominimus]OLF49940.1 sugar ABC transporter ATP-binding protein [Streptococcus acidominimus]SUN07848.1 ribose transport ATP-binding protein RbsA [Streptococcus acidominimus]